MAYSSDPERQQPSASCQRLPSRSDLSHNPDQKNKSKIWSSISNFLHFFGGGIYSPDASVMEPIEMFLNAEDHEERRRLAEKWKENRLQELNFVGVVSALLAGVLTSTGSWPSILPNGRISPWPIRTSWYCGIILSLFSLLSAADQTVRLHRMSSHRDAERLLHGLLAKPIDVHRQRARQNDSRRIKPRPGAVFVWQLPVMFLTTATIAMIVGLFLHVWSSTELYGDFRWSDDTYVAVTYSIIAVICIVIFFGGQVTLHVPNKSDSDSDD